MKPSANLFSGKHTRLNSVLTMHTTINTKPWRDAFINYGLNSRHS